MREEQDDGTLSEPLTEIEKTNLDEAQESPDLNISEALIEPSAPTWLTYLLSGFKLAVILLLTLFLLFLTLSLASFSPSDPAWSKPAVEVSRLTNLGGVAGAYTADVLYYLFGFSIWWVVFYLALLLCNLIFSSPKTQEGSYSFSYALSFFSLLLLLFATELLEQFYLGAFIPNTLPMGTGGLIGQMSFAVLKAFDPYFVRIGTWIIFALALIGMTQGSVRTFSSTGWKKTRALWHWYQKKFHERQQAVPQSARERHLEKLLDITRAPLTPLSVAMRGRKTMSSHRPHSPQTTAAQDHSAPSNDSGEGAAEEETQSLPTLFHRKAKRKAKLPSHRSEGKDLSVLIKQVFTQEGVGIKFVRAYITPKFFNFQVKLNQPLNSSWVQKAVAALKKELPQYPLYLEQPNAARADFILVLQRQKAEFLALSELLREPLFPASSAPLLLALGRDIKNEPLFAPLAKMPNLLVAATDPRSLYHTFNSLLVTLLTKNTKRDLQLLLFGHHDSALAAFAGIPHSLAPLADTPEKIVGSLAWALLELKKRLAVLRLNEVKDRAALNEKIAAAEIKGSFVPNPFSMDPDDPEPLGPLPYLVLIFDMADGFSSLPLDSLRALAEEGYKAGIHLILGATPGAEKPLSRELKALFPTRLVFRLDSGLESISLLQEKGAEELEETDDAFLLTPMARHPRRLQTPLVEQQELRLFLTSYGDKTHYPDEIMRFSEIESAKPAPDDLYEVAVSYVLESKKTSVSALQRKLKIGYNRADNLLERMEQDKILSKAELGGKRRILKYPS